MPYLQPGHVIDGFVVTGLCSDEGGMGTLYHVQPSQGSGDFPVVMKVCKVGSSGEDEQRFIREVRYLLELNGNSRVVQTVASNLSGPIPYYVMKFYERGDVSNISDRVQNDIEFQEGIFYALLDCIEELHSLGMVHRDIKPENFLLDGDRIVVSDFGLSKFPGRGTTFTKHAQSFGTVGYAPPESLMGDFRDLTPAADIFMLGKTLYGLVSGRPVVYMTPQGFPPSIYRVISKCCSFDPVARYQSVAELRQDLRLAYDIVLGRGSQIDKVRALGSQVRSRLESANEYSVDEVRELINGLLMLDERDIADTIYDWPSSFFFAFSHPELAHALESFLAAYRPFALNAVGTWSYAETVASNMEVVFKTTSIPAHAAAALDIAIECAEQAHRFAAMDTCRNMITGVIEDSLGESVAAVLVGHPESFVKDIDTSSCGNDRVRAAIRSLAGRN